MGRTYSHRVDSAHDIRSLDWGKFEQSRFHDRSKWRCYHHPYRRRFSHYVYGSNYVAAGIALIVLACLSVGLLAGPMRQNEGSFLKNYILTRNC